MPLEQNLIDPIDAARYLGVSPSTLNSWRVKRVGPAFVKVGRMVRYAPDALRAFVDENTKKVAQGGKRGGR